MARRSVYRCSPRACALGAAVLCTFAPVILLAGPASAGTAAAVSVKVSPNRGLVNGQVVTVSGRGLSRSATGSGLTWFVSQCTASVRWRMNPATDTPHCDVTDAKAIRIGRDGSFSTRFHVRAGIVGDGYCGTAGHATCVIAVSTAKGQGSVAKISFAPASTTTTTTMAAGASTTTTTAG
jgi:hypothetical protein